MMKRLHHIGLCCALLPACAAEHDIVAEPLPPDARAASIDSGTHAGGGVDASAHVIDAVVMDECCRDARNPGSDGPDAGSTGTDICSTGADTFFLLTKEDDGRLYRVSASLGIPEDRGAPGCLPVGPLAAAVDTRGMLWVAALGDGTVYTVDPDKLDCRPKLKLTADAMTFGFDPDTKLERLYVLEKGVLSIIDPFSFASSTYGKLEPSWLAGTVDGRLFALSDPSSGAVMINEISPPNATATLRSKIPLPFDQPLRAATLPAGGFALIFGTDLYRVPPGADGAWFVRTLFADRDPGILAVAAPPCGSLPK